MRGSAGSAGASLGARIGVLVVTFALVTGVSGTLLGLNWTQAVLLGGFAGTVSVASAWLTARRAGGAGED